MPEQENIRHFSELDAIDAFTAAIGAHIRGLNIKKYQETSCKNPRYAYLFARYIKGAYIKYCQKAACKNPYYAYYFALHIERANIDMSLEACKVTQYEAKLSKYLMNKALK